MFGDQVVVKINEKSLELAGVEVTYLHCDKENSHLATVLHRAPVLDKGIETHTVLEVHLVWLKPDPGQTRPEQVMAGAPTKVGGSRGSSLVGHLSTEAAAGTTRAPRPQEVGGAAAHGPRVAGLEVRGRVEGDGNGEGVEAQKYSVIPPSASADAAAQPSRVNQKEEEWGRVKEELFGDRALEMKAEEGQVQEEGGAMLIAKQGQLTLPQTQSNRPSPPTKIPYSRRMLQSHSDVCKYSEEFGGDAPFLALASFQKGVTMLPTSREEIARGEF
uniref:Uncharacterized protein n=1 Tax=Chromera velia CCMP2878 TaxID=1169474 RepID=A0A0G4HTQ8_9ALVE|eukprot:Cvel_31524.t1-p1 / transcript=Cvel_31524.t1 / gene=Cvel_31524 / organism=Chromera_velia_CCMP2878 / gene_product=hypothetical protein / transcript_product=hypothetical protein / location=Cvel_scaffold4709:2501-3626(-) / protein_length=272 / sequence_SO=supercontig / SO=protein_coding / is_pseudo=false